MDDKEKLLTPDDLKRDVADTFIRMHLAGVWGIGFTIGVLALQAEGILIWGIVALLIASPVIIWRAPQALRRRYESGKTAA
ncbi:MAG: hypothetical protein WD076_11725 [Parvularculaceae bacterium]